MASIMYLHSLSPRSDISTGSTKYLEEEGIFIETNWPSKTERNSFLCGCVLSYNELTVNCQFYEQTIIKQGYNSCYLIVQRRINMLGNLYSWKTKFLSASDYVTKLNTCSYFS